MSKINQRIIQSISTGPQLSEPLPKDVIIGPAAGSPGTQYIQRRRYLYRWPNRQERNLDKIKLYQGTIMPPPSQVRFYRNRARRVIAIFENGHDIEPPFLEESQIPNATIITTLDFLCNVPSTSVPQVPSPSAPRQESSFNFQEQSSCRETSNNDSPRRAPYTHPTTNDINNRDRGESTTGEKRWREIDDDERGDASKRLKQPSLPQLSLSFLALRLGPLTPMS